MAVRKNRIGLRGKAVADMSNIPHVNRRAIDGLNGKVVQFVHRSGTSIHLDGVLERAELCGAGWQNEVLRVDGIDDVHGG